MGLLALALLVASLVYPFEYVRRVLAYRDSDVQDYLEYFLYNKYHPLLLGLILECATGVSVTEYMQRVL